MRVRPCTHIMAMHVCLYAYIERHTHPLKTVPREEHNNTLIIYHTILQPPLHPLTLTTLQICLKLMHSLGIRSNCYSKLMFRLWCKDKNYKTVQKLNCLEFPSSDQRKFSWKTNALPPHKPYQTIPYTCAVKTRTDYSTPTKTLLRVNRYMGQQVNLTDGMIKINYLNDKTKKDYKNNHMTI